VRESDEKVGAAGGVFLSQFLKGRDNGRGRKERAKGAGAMGEMKARVYHAKQRTPLVVKASLPHTFLGLGVFVEVALLFFGSYLLAQTVLQPLEAGTATILGAGLFLALASVLLFYLLWPGQAKSISRREEPSETSGEILLTPYGNGIHGQPDAQWMLKKKGELSGPM
jgi:hypothetical protein